MPQDFTMRQLRYFVAAAETGQFSMAAASEHVSQSAVTNAVSALEQLLGTRLFDRLPHGVSLTLDGHEFYHHARHVIDSLSDALHRSRARSRDTEGVVHIGASYTVMGYFLPEVLARFRATYPRILFELHDLDRCALERAVESGDIDIAVALLSNVAQVDRFEHRSLVRSQRKLWIAPFHPLAQFLNPSLRDIAEHPYVMLTVDEGEDSAMRYWAEQDLVPNVILRTGSMEALRGFVSHGFGVAILSEMVFRPWSLDGKRIESRDVATLIPQLDLGMLWRKHTAPPPPVRTLMDFLIHSRQRL